MSSFGQNRFCVDVYEVGLFFGLKFVVYYIDNHFGGDRGGEGSGGAVIGWILWVCNKTQL